MLLSERKSCKNKSGIYKITNTISGMSYIGQAANIATRIYQHLHSSISEKAKDYDYPLHKAIRKYGVDSFVLEILEECSGEALNDREMHWVAFYDTFKNGYNQTAGGYQSIRQIKLTEADVERIRFILINTDTTFKKIAQDFGICDNMVSRINKGQTWFDANLQYPLRDNHAVQLKHKLDTGYGIYQLDKKTGEVVNIFISATQAALHFGGEEYCAHIGKCLAGKRKSAYGFYWESRPITKELQKELIQKADISDRIKNLF